MNGGWGISYVIALRWMPLDLTKSTLLQVMAWCRQATSHYLSQCWPWSVSPNGVTRPQWVNIWHGFSNMASAVASIVCSSPIYCHSDNRCRLNPFCWPALEELYYSPFQQWLGAECQSISTWCPCLVFSPHMCMLPGPFWWQPETIAGRDGKMNIASCSLWYI